MNHYVCYYERTWARQYCYFYLFHLNHCGQDGVWMTCDTCRYWHRSLNPKKLIEVKFSHLSRNMTMQRTLKLYKLPDSTRTPGFRKLLPQDVPKAHKLLADVRAFAFIFVVALVSFPLTDHIRMDKVCGSGRFTEKKTIGRSVILILNSRFFVVSSIFINFNLNGIKHC